VFKGTPSRGNIMQELGKRGMAFNGSTGFDRTNYFQSFNASGENLKWALEMEADRMVNSFIRKSDLDSEMTVGAQRVRERREQPAARAVRTHARARLTSGTTTGTSASARALTSRTSTSAACRRSTSCTTSRTTRC
jgi:predicted Zn-dependent peptidase